MRADVARDLERSTKAFLSVVWPAIAPLVGMGTFVPVESINNDGLALDLDVLAGIDGFHIVRERGMMRGIASRVQFGERSWGTFTIRYGRVSGFPTEWEKRMKAREAASQGWLQPALAVHAYVTPNGDALLGAAVVPYPELINFILEHLEAAVEGADTRAPVYMQATDNASFLCARWDAMEKAAVRFRSPVVPLSPRVPFNNEPVKARDGRWGAIVPEPVDNIYGPFKVLGRTDGLFCVMDTRRDQLSATHHVYATERDARRWAEQMAHALDEGPWAVEAPDAEAI